MLWLLLLWFGDSHARPVRPYSDDAVLDAEAQVTASESHDPFIPMPNHLRTHSEMVAWMTEELPKRAAEMALHPHERREHRG